MIIIYTFEKVIKTDEKFTEFNSLHFWKMIKIDEKMKLTFLDHRWPLLNLIKHCDMKTTETFSQAFRMVYKMYTMLLLGDEHGPKIVTK